MRGYADAFGIGDWQKSFHFNRILRPAEKQIQPKTNITNIASISILNMLPLKRLTNENRSHPSLPQC